MMESAVRVWQGRGALSHSDKAPKCLLVQRLWFQFSSSPILQGPGTAATTNTTTDSNLKSDELRDSHRHCVCVCVCVCVQYGVERTGN